jgi:hypothetical protein
MTVLSTNEGVLLIAVKYMITGLKLLFEQMWFGLHIWCDLLAKQTWQAKAMQSQIRRNVGKNNQDVEGICHFISNACFECTVIIIAIANC